MTELSLLEDLFQKRRPDVSAAAFANTLARLVWTLNDNGEHILESLSQWILTPFDRERVEVALSVAADHAFLFRTYTEVAQASRSLHQMWPDLGERFDSIASTWNGKLK